MKKHGHYNLPTVEELMQDCSVDGCTQEYFSRQLQRLKKKHYGNKKHKEKIKKRFINRKYSSR